MTKGRIEAFSDGVIAILITIMVLEVKVPHGHDLDTLLPLLPIFSGYVLSFVFLGIYWNNHHHMFQAVKDVNGRVLWANLHLLFWLSLVPVATTWVGENHDAAGPTAFYGFLLIMSGFAYTYLQGSLMRIDRNREILERALGDDRKGRLTLLVYVAGIAPVLRAPLARATLLRRGRARLARAGFPPRARARPRRGLRHGVSCHDGGIDDSQHEPTMTVLIASLLLAKVPAPLHVQGTRILDDKDRPVRLRGVNVASLEFSTNGEGHVLDTLRVAIDDWKSDIVRLPLSQDRWFGKAPDQSALGPERAAEAYRALVSQAVDVVVSRGAYVLLDLHWNDAGHWGENIGQHKMPDEHSVDFWKSCAAVYKNRPGVLFDLYNETHDVSWEVWKDGGAVEENQRVGAGQGAFKPVRYQAPGMQTLLDTIRATGANNVVVVGGLDWAYDLSAFLKGYALKDSPEGRGLIYACHAYDNKGDAVPTFLAKLDAVLPKIPVIISEFGDTPKRGPDHDRPTPWLTSVLAAIEARGCNWTAWDLHPAAGPTLISGWNYAPTTNFGVPVKAALAKSG